MVEKVLDEPVAKSYQLCCVSLLVSTVGSGWGRNGVMKKTLEPHPLRKILPFKLKLYYAFLKEPLIFRGPTKICNRFLKNYIGTEMFTTTQRLFNQ